MPDYKKNIELIRKNIKEASEECGFNENDITLLVASKYADADALNKVLSLGVDCLGENKVQDFLKKYDSVVPNDRWHFIGQLQSNKVRHIIDKVGLIHSLDRLSLAKEIDRHAKARGIIANVLVELNVTDIEDRGGVSLEQVESFIDEVKALYENINIQGLMTVLPDIDDFSKLDKICFEIKQIYDKLSLRYAFKYLSMGMSNDYRIALRHGANIIRIGSLIFKQ